MLYRLMQKTLLAPMVPAFALAIAAAASFVAFGPAPVAMALSHEYINMTRSSSESHIFVVQSVEGEYGSYKTGSTDSSPSATGQTSVQSSASQAGAIAAADSYPSKQNWSGYGIRTALGVEIMKFLEFSAAHTLVTMHSQENSLENLHGSRLSGETRAVFDSPVGNLELGLGVTGSRLDYQRQLESSSFYGTGFYTLLGINYFLTPRVSFEGSFKLANEHLVRNSGSSVVMSMDSSTTLAGLGFILWL